MQDYGASGDQAQTRQHASHALQGNRKRVHPPPRTGKGQPTSARPHAQQASPQDPSPMPYGRSWSQLAGTAWGLLRLHTAQPQGLLTLNSQQKLNSRNKQSSQYFKNLLNVIIKALLWFKQSRSEERRLCLRKKTKTTISSKDFCTCVKCFILLSILLSNTL